MEKINFSNITSLNFSNKTECLQNMEDNYTNENILIFDDKYYEMEKKEMKKKNKLEFERILQQTKQKFILLSEKAEQIINNKSFSFKKILANNLNIQAIQLDGKNNSNNNMKQNIFFNGKTINVNKNENNNNNYMNNNILKSNSNKSILSINNNDNSMNSKMKNHFKVIEPFNSNNNKGNILMEISDDIENSSLIGKKRQQKNNNKIEKIEKKEKNIKEVFNEILMIYGEIYNIDNNIIKIEEQNILKNDDDNQETTIIIDNKQIAKIYLNNNIINKIYVFKNKKYIEKENEILSQLKIIKKSMNGILNKLKKNNNL